MASLYEMQAMNGEDVLRRLIRHHPTMQLNKREIDDDNIQDAVSTLIDAYNSAHKIIFSTGDRPPFDFGGGGGRPMDMMDMMLFTGIALYCVENYQGDLKNAGKIMKMSSIPAIAKLSPDDLVLKEMTHGEAPDQVAQSTAHPQKTESPV